MTRGTGLLSLVAKADLSSLMGRNQQFLSPFPTLHALANNSGFLLLDCACSLVSQSGLGDLSETANAAESDEEEEEEEEDEDEDSWSFFLKQALRTQLYNLSGIERFKIKPRQPKFLQRKFSLVWFSFF